MKLYSFVTFVGLKKQRNFSNFTTDLIEAFSLLFGFVIFYLKYGRDYDNAGVLVGKLTPPSFWVYNSLRFSHAILTSAFEKKTGVGS